MVKSDATARAACPNLAGLRCGNIDARTRQESYAPLRPRSQQFAVTQFARLRTGFACIHNNPNQRKKSSYRSKPTYRHRQPLFEAAGLWHLCYEIHLTNLSPSTWTLQGIAVTSETGATATERSECRAGQRSLSSWTHAECSTGCRSMTSRPAKPSSRTCG